MPYQLRNGLSYCEVDGRLVFLDLERDRYFQLPERFASALAAVLDHAREAPADEDVQALVARNILIASTGPGHLPPYRHDVARPERSALELQARGRASLQTVLEVGRLVASTRVKLRACRIARLLDAVVERRDRLAGAAQHDATAASVDQMLAAAGLLHHARGYVPIEPCCLFDSIALVGFLARRRLHARIHFGVTLDPFAAHCWVQAGGWVLNDSVGNALAHTPIRSL